jgi:hypothetical protein
MRTTMGEVYSSGGPRRIAWPILVAGLVLLAAFGALVLAPGAAASDAARNSTLNVPSPSYPTIQSAINAATPGQTILIAPGTYVEQLTISKSLNLVGSGAGRTIIESPAVLAPDAFGNPWTIEIGNGATANLFGFTLLMTPQCILPSGLPPDPTVHPHVAVYAGGGIGVGGSAVLNLESAVVTTTGGTEGASCGATGFLSYGTGVDFGLDYVAGSPAASELVGSGTVSGVSISGFGFGGPGLSIGGQANSPAGSSAHVFDSQITTSSDESGANIAPAISVGFGGNSSSATVVANYLSTLPSLGTDVVEVFSGSTADIAHNLILDGPENDAVSVLSSTVTIASNWIHGSTSDFSGGIILISSTATVVSNTMSDFQCEFNSFLESNGYCGPSDLNQAQVVALLDGFDPGLGTVIENNLISDSDVGIALGEGCFGCTVKGNILVDSLDYALAGYDGSYTFDRNVVIGGLYAVAAVAVTANTSVTLSHVVMIGQSAPAPPFYYENDCLVLFGYSCSAPSITGT